MKDPPRGQQDAHAPRASGTSTRDAYRDLLRNRPYVLAVLGYAAYTFALGGLGFWMPAFLERARGMPRSDATVTFGVMVMVTGFVGTFLGGWLGDQLLTKTKQSYLWVSGIATLLAAPITLLGLMHRDKAVYLAALIRGAGAHLHVHRPDQLRDRERGLAAGARDRGRAVGVRHARPRRHPVAAR